MIGLFNWVIGSVAEDEPLISEDRICRLNVRLNCGSIVIALIHLVFTLFLGLYQISLVFAAAALAWAGIGMLMRRGYHSVALPLQHATGLAMITAVAVALGPGVNVQLAFLLASAMPPLVWTIRKRVEWWVHLGTAVSLWAVVEAGLLQRFASITLSDQMAVVIRIELGLFIFAAFALFIHSLIILNHRTEARFQESNGLLEEQIRERERVERQLEAARDVAERADRAKDDFLANMSHEIRTPMNTILGLAGLCRRSKMSPKVREYIGRIRSSSRVLLGIINDILDLSRIEARTIELDEVSFDLWKALDHLADLVGDSASAKGIELLMSADSEVPRMLMGDPLRLGQVLTNLTSNAIKFTSDGSVVVQVQLVGEDAEYVNLRFAVEDTGIGIPEHLVAGLFESFVQADRSTTRRYGGSGLGLTISKRLVELMGGDIQVESEEGRGSVFAFELTLAKAPSTIHENFKPPLEFEGLRVLVVHDNPVASDAICSLLSSLKFVPHAARSETECLEVLARHQEESQRFGLVLVNWIMPDSDGIEICRRVGSDPGLAKVPTVVMVTSKRLEEVTQLADVAEVAGVLVKPIRAGDLLAVLAEACGSPTRESRRRISSALTPMVHPIKGSRILLVEDDETHQQVAQEILESAGLEVTIVDSGEDAVREARKSRYDVVLMDVHMPGLDGPAATAVLRAEPMTSHVPIIAVTADVLTETRARCFKSGMNDFIAKPISVSELLTKLMHWIGPDKDRPTGPAYSSVHEVVAFEQSQGLLDDAATNHGDGDRGATEPQSKPTSWFGRLIDFGVSPAHPVGLAKRIRLANGLVLALIAIAVAYTPIYLVAGLSTIAGITAAMGVFWLISYAMMIRGWHRSGRFLMTSVAIVGCFAYAYAFGPKANYQALLFNGMILPPIIFTLRERYVSWGFGAASMVLWVVAESGALARYSLVQVDNTLLALLHANATLICFGFLAFAISSLARENFRVEERYQAANTRLRAEIEELTKAEVALMGARERAEDARHAKSDFLANMSHEIRTPMNAILGLTELSLRCELTASVRDQISRIQSSAQALLGIVNDILDISRLEAQRIELETVDFNLDPVLDQLTGLAGHAASSKGLEFFVVADPDVPHMFRGDPLRLGQVLSNLADNAVNATERGEIVVRVERLATDRSHAHLRFSVSDTGVGFPFQSIADFSATLGKTGSPVADRRPGSGLGLMLAGRLVELMGGMLQVESELQVGSTFWFDIQLEQGEGDETISAPPGKYLGARILVVSCHAIAADVISSMVSSCGFVPTVATSENEVEQLLIAAYKEDAPYRVIVIDRPTGTEDSKVVLPNLPDASKLPMRLLLVTARDRANLGSPSEVDGIVVKPVRRAALFDAILASFGHVLIPPDDDMPRDLRSEIHRIHGARVLVVEDNEANQIVARGILEDAGLVVDVVGNGSEAIEAVERSSYHLVFMDLHMPLMDGYEATRGIRRILDNVDLPIVAMTADAREETQEACLVAGMNDHVTKPLDRMVLLSNLVSWIPPINDGTDEATGNEPTVSDSLSETGDIFEFPGLDVDEALERLSGRRNILADVLASFGRRYRDREAEIEKAWNRRNPERAMELAHQIKGSAGNISAHELFAVSARLETAIREGNRASVPDLITEHRRNLDQVLGSIETLEQTLREDRNADQSGDANERVSLEALLPELAELIRLLESSSLRAQNVFAELRSRLDDQELERDLESIAANLGDLNFAAARDRVVKLLQGRGLEIEGAGQS